METIQEEIRYCTNCGAANKKSAVFCEECEKKIILRHRPFVDFLKKQIKSGAKGKAAEKVFSLIRDFLFEHLYGMILTVSVVATTTVMIANATPYIKKVTSTPFERGVSGAAEGVFELTERDETWIPHVTGAYDAEIDNSRRSGVTYWSHDDYYSSATDLWAENNIEGYTYKGKHELYENPLPMGQDILNDEVYDRNSDRWDREGKWPWHCRYTPIEGIRMGSNVKSALGHTLLKDGYDVLEADFYCLTFMLNKGDFQKAHNFDNKALPPKDMTAYEKYVYTFLLTKKHGEDKWYIAEEVLTERVGGSDDRG